MPTVKTPAHFIKYLNFYKKNWNQDPIQKELLSYNISSKTFPDTSNIKFVQLDEFYPIRPDQHYSFIYYLKKYYFPLLQLQPEHILTFEAFVDYDIEEMCDRYEHKIAQWGGIGFFLGGIGPDGHVAFNMKGSSFASTTRVTLLNYPSAAASAGSLGGIAFARNKPVITIGLKTIIALPDATIIIIAAGQGKADVVAQAVQGQKTRKSPTSILQGNPCARFYVTKDAACNLIARQAEDLENEGVGDTPELIDDVLAECAFSSTKQIIQLTQGDVSKSSKGQVIIKKHTKNFSAYIQDSTERIKQKIQRGLNLPSGLTIMHTEPHHDDIMLSYHSLAVELLKNNKNFFVSVTSGFNSVANTLLLQLFNKLTYGCLHHLFSTILSTSHETLIAKFIQAYKHNDEYQCEECQFALFIKNIIQAFQIDDADILYKTVRQIETLLANDLYATSEQLQKLKGCMRETEVDCLWALHDVAFDHITHMRSQFYTSGGVPTHAEDVLPLVRLIETINPDIITVAFDPPGAGPTTHYKVLQLIAEALRSAKSIKKSIEIWGYRNVWDRFSIGQASMIIPVNSEELEDLDKEFCTCFLTQREAMNPSGEFDGPFSKLSCDIAKEQFNCMKTILGEDYFTQHHDKKLSSAEGMLFIKQMSLSTFLFSCQTLQRQAEIE